MVPAVKQHKRHRVARVGANFQRRKMDPEKALEHSLIKDEDRERVRQEQKQGRTRGER